MPDTVRDGSYCASNHSVDLLMLNTHYWRRRSIDLKSLRHSYGMMSWVNSQVKHMSIFEDDDDAHDQQNSIPSKESSYDFKIVGVRSKMGHLTDVVFSAGAGETALTSAVKIYLTISKRTATTRRRKYLTVVDAADRKSWILDEQYYSDQRLVDIAYACAGTGA